MDLLCELAERDNVGYLRMERWRAHFRLVESVPERESEFYLRFRDGRLSLCKGGDERGVEVRVQDVERRTRGDFLLGRACGGRRGSVPSILDATAGLGLDGVALAMAGYRMTLMEREPVLWVLLDNLLQRVGLNGVTLHLGETETMLDSSNPPSWDVIYLDPMFPDRNKTALPAKRMQYLAAVLGDSRPFDDRLIDKARTKARSRVVLKRRLKDPMIGRPDWQIRGRSVRFDVYRAGG